MSAPRLPLRFLLRCQGCGREARRKYPANPKTIRCYTCRSCGGDLILVSMAELWKRRAAELAELRKGEA